MQQKIEAIIQQHDIILFDEICVLCNGWAKFLIKYDTQAQFKLTSMQSPLGQDILRYYQMPTEYFDSMLVIKNGQAYSESTAFLKVIESLGLPFSCLKMGYLIPRFIRDFLYRQIAFNRYRLLGTTDQCLFISSRHQQHFLEYAVDESTASN
ncbi:thiol-disulfide oxidoreductase DCC family protein [Acinetobacter sp. WZC-1]|uniref:thiol-disulfide oxidoreductase DCC family protein n=1 Tax=Acinetobacter sp. WZC-1 TaxID=3459034 RepID=UPI00403E34F3